MLICPLYSVGACPRCMLICLLYSVGVALSYANLCALFCGRGPQCMLICRCTLWAWSSGGRGCPSRGALGRRTLGAADPLPELVHVGPGLCSGSAPGHAPLRMEVEDSGGVVLTAYHSHARSQPQGAEPRCASRASHPLSRYGAALRAARASGGAGRGQRLGKFFFCGVDN